MSPGSVADRRQSPFRALFWRCLAKAFLPPREPEFFRAFREDWPGLLREIARSAGLRVEGDVDAIRVALNQIDNSQDLLVAYSRLFLVPPVAAPLNLGLYVDGSLFGGSARTLDALYRAHGLAPASGVLKDNPDHLARVIEFLGVLSSAEADVEHPTESPEEAEGAINTVRSRYLLRALPELVRRAADAETAHGLPSVYSRILSLTLAAARDHDGVLFEGSPGRAEPDQKASGEQGVAPELTLCSQCGAPIIAAADLRIIAERLRMANLPVEHLGLCPDCRHAGRAWQRNPFGTVMRGFH
jgi:nitrate reductase assembly molybdenum cofactor insertion protein NarJ